MGEDDGMSGLAKTWKKYFKATWVRGVRCYVKADWQENIRLRREIADTNLKYYKLHQQLTTTQEENTRLLKELDYYAPSMEALLDALGKIRIIERKPGTKNITIKHDDFMYIMALCNKVKGV